MILALADEGVTRRKEVFARIDEKTLVIQASGVKIPDTKASVKVVDFKGMGLKPQDWSLGAVAMLAKMKKVLANAMLDAALGHRFRGEALVGAKAVAETVTSQGD